MVRGWCARLWRQLSPRSAGPGAGVPSLSWIGQERIAIGSVPPAGSVADLAGQGVTHVVNWRTHGQVWLRGDLAAERRFSAWPGWCTPDAGLGLGAAAAIVGGGCLLRRPGSG